MLISIPPRKTLRKIKLIVHCIHIYYRLIVNWMFPVANESHKSSCIHGNYNLVGIFNIISRNNCKYLTVKCTLHTQLTRSYVFTNLTPNTHIQVVVVPDKITKMIADPEPDRTSRKSCGDDLEGPNYYHLLTDSCGSGKIRPRHFFTFKCSIIVVY